MQLARDLFGLDDAAPAQDEADEAPAEVRELRRPQR
jgi:hypothetical protein